MHACMRLHTIFFLFFAVSGEDFIISDTQLIFGPCNPCDPGETVKEVVVNIRDDDNLELESTFGVAVSSSVPEGLTTQPSAITIMDDGI